MKFFRVIVGGEVTIWDDYTYESAINHGIEFELLEVIEEKGYKVIYGGSLADGSDHGIFNGGEYSSLEQAIKIAKKKYATLDLGWAVVEDIHGNVLWEIGNVNI